LGSLKAEAAPTSNWKGCRDGPVFTRLMNSDIADKQKGREECGGRLARTKELDLQYSAVCDFEESRDTPLRMLCVAIYIYSQ